MSSCTVLYCTVLVPSSFVIKCIHCVCDHMGRVRIRRYLPFLYLRSAITAHLDSRQQSFWLVRGCCCFWAGLAWTAKILLAAEARQLAATLRIPYSVLRTSDAGRQTNPSLTRFCSFPTRHPRPVQPQPVFSAPAHPLFIFTLLYLTVPRIASERYLSFSSLKDSRST